MPAVTSIASPSQNRNPEPSAKLPVVTITITGQVVSTLPTSADRSTPSRITLFESATLPTPPLLTETPELRPELNYTTIINNANNPALIAVV
ncbi:hypothetical protein P154DRAFT_581532 [Amniculicola lignicola CBS 123094]|uniref:Uncharacterized protein n=1 Tax=Amniculicola lignicola CBS 123094 TaxID=1392246 RepID=A0A6A5WAN5_9PLEO|nr:hypothetical protein P154DRAFT_581532 [Amniculicola lignicola CBS 123094]